MTDKNDGQFRLLSHHFI